MSRALIIEAVKHSPSGTDSRSRTNRRPGSRSSSTTGSKRVAAASGLSSSDLLAKIDSLDWDETVSPGMTVRTGTSAANAQSRSPRRSWSVASVAGIGILVVGIAFALYVVLAPDSSSRSANGQVRKAIPASAESARTEERPVTGTTEHEDRLAAMAAAEDRRTAMYEKAVLGAEKESQRKADRLRKAREAEQAALAAQQERERRLQQDAAARQRAEQEAAAAAEREAARAREAAAVPKGPSSPQELCAGEGNVFGRGLCEARACGKPEWRNHPFCVKRIEDQLRSIGQGG